MTLIATLVGGLWARFAPYLIAAGIGAAVLIGAYQTGVRAERKRGEAAVLRAEVATLKADIAIARTAAADAAARSTAIAAATAADTAIIEEVRRAPTNTACIADPAGARRVQSIGSGGARRQP